MKYIEKTEQLKKTIDQKNIKIKSMNILNILMDSLAYDWEYNTTQIKLLKEREKYIQTNYIENQLNGLQLKFDETLTYIKNKHSDISSNNLITLLIIEEVLSKWWSIFWVGSNKIKFNLESQIESNIWVTKSICKLVFEVFHHKPFLRFNFTKWLLLWNYLLNNIWLPGINFSYKDRKRILRHIDHYIDFEKEFFLTLQGECNRVIQEKISPKSIISVEDLKKKKNTTWIYLKPGTWWYGEDRKKYTFIK